LGNSGYVDNRVGLGDQYTQARGQGQTNSSSSRTQGNSANKPANPTLQDLTRREYEQSLQTLAERLESCRDVFANEEGTANQAPAGSDPVWGPPALAQTNAENKAPAKPTQGHSRNTRANPTLQDLTQPEYELSLQRLAEHLESCRDVFDDEEGTASTAQAGNDPVWGPPAQTTTGNRTRADSRRLYERGSQETRNADGDTNTVIPGNFSEELDVVRDPWASYIMTTGAGTPGAATATATSLMIPRLAGQWYTDLSRYIQQANVFNMVGPLSQPQLNHLGRLYSVVPTAPIITSLSPFLPNLMPLMPVTPGAQSVARQSVIDGNIVRDVENLARSVEMMYFAPQAYYQDPTDLMNYIMMNSSISEILCPVAFGNRVSLFLLVVPEG